MATAVPHCESCSRRATMKRERANGATEWLCTQHAKGQPDVGPITWLVEYVCQHGDERTGYDVAWQDEVPTPTTWGYCPEDGKRRSPFNAQVAGWEG